MADDLNEVKERVEWARGQITILASELLTYIQTGGFVTSIEDGPDGMTTLSVARGNKTMPTSIRINTGVIAHELRATLDSLACTLAVRNGQAPKNVYFPVSRSEAIFLKDGLDKISKLSIADRAMITALIPYAEGNPLLFALHGCDLLRKHQRLVATTDGIGTFRLAGNANAFTFHPKGPISKTPRPVVGFETGMIWTGDVAIDIQFSEPAFLTGKAILPTLRQFTGLVQSVIELFD